MSLKSIIVTAIAPPSCDRFVVICWLLVVMNQINRVAIIGGTHGNEFTGAYLMKKFEQFPDLIKRPSFETLTLLGNPKAFAECKRY
jgi:succinylglutamate desuccinylase